MGPYRGTQGPTVTGLHKDALLALVGKEPNLVALAVYVRRGDLNSSGGPFDKQHILSQLHHQSTSSTWNIFSTVQNCRFIAGNERARAVIFSRHQRSSIQNTLEMNSQSTDAQQPVCSDGFSVLDKDGWVQMCMQCGGGGEG